MELEIRERRADDEAGVKAVRAEAFKRLREVYRPTAGAVALGESSTKIGELVATAGGRIVGDVRFREREGRLHLIGLAVLPAFQRHGVARAMVARLVETARERGLREMSLFTIEQTGNVAIFEKLGFVVAARGPAENAESVTGEELTEAFMIRPCG